MYCCTRSILAACAATVGTLLPAQRELTNEALAAPLPIHSQPDDPVGGAYGFWTAGADFKASFADGFTFYPWRPGAQTTLGLRWQTESVRRGTQELLAGESAVHADAHRYEIVRGALREIYDVLPAGVEQRFVLAGPPAGEGDLIVTGRVTTSFTAPAVPPRPGAIEFCCDGEPAMRYGRALAFDAAGRTADVATGFDGKRIRLVVPEAFVAAATFPLTIDPLSSNAAVRSSAQPIVATATTCSTQNGVARVIVAVVREFSATDMDAYAFLSSKNPGPGMLDVFSDVTTAWSTNTVDLAEIGGATRWVLAIEREFTSGSVAARAYVHDFASSSLNTGTTLFAALDTAAPRVGGSLGTGTKALMVCGIPTGAAQYIVDGATPALGPQQIHQFFAADWAVSRAASAGTRWAVITQTTLSPLLQVRLVDDTGASTPSQDVPDTTNGTSPQIDGNGTRFVATWIETDTAAGQRRLRARRIELAPGQPVAALPVRTLLSTLSLNAISHCRVAYDYLTTSHWVVAFHTRTLLGSFQGRLLRLGYTGGITENVDLDAAQGADAILPSVAFHGPETGGSGFAVCYAVPGAIGQLVHRRLDYDPQAGVSYYDSSCASVTLGDGHPPYAGSQFYRLNLSGVAPGTLCLHVVGVAPLSAPLDFLGMFGCKLLVDPVLTTLAIADPTGLAFVPYALPDAPLFTGELYAQWFWVDPPANAFGWRSSVGAAVHVR